MHALPDSLQTTLAIRFNFQLLPGEHRNEKHGNVLLNGSIFPDLLSESPCRSRNATLRRRSVANDCQTTTRTIATPIPALEQNYTLHTVALNSVLLTVRLQFRSPMRVCIQYMQLLNRRRRYF